MEEQRYSYRFYQHSTFSPAIHGHSLKFRMIPCENDCQHLEQQQMLTEPACSLLSAFDGMGNRLQYGFCQAPHAFFRIESQGVVTCRRYLLPDPQPSYLWRCASPLAAWDCAMQQWAQQVTAQCPAQPEAQVRALMLAVHQHVSYRRYCTDNSTTALDTFRHAQGVCQDFAHLLIALCRSIGLLARYANGLVVGLNETHAWVEVHYQGAWHAFDPTHNTAVEWGYIKLAHGRDVNDCPCNRGRFLGWTNECLTVQTEVIQL